MITLETIPTPDTTFTVRRIGDETIFINEKGDRLHTINELGSFIWEHIDGDASLGDILDSVLSEYEAEREEAQEDLRRFIKELEEKGIVSLRST